MLAKLFVKLLKPLDFKSRERNGFQYVEMAIFANDVVGIGNNSAINKFVVILVGCDQPKPEMSINSDDVIGSQNGFNSDAGSQRRHVRSNNLLVFLKNLVRNAERLFAKDKVFPNLVINTSPR